MTDICNKLLYNKLNILSDIILLDPFRFSSTIAEGTLWLAFKVQNIQNIVAAINVL